MRVSVFGLGCVGCVTAACLAKAGHTVVGVDVNAEKVALYKRQKLPDVPLSELIDHIEHIAKVAGYDHVCLGSSFDEAPMMPSGLEDVSKLPVITALLRERGWTEPNVRKLLGENALRVLQASESP